MSDPIRLLVFGDTHLKPIETAIDYEHLQVPSDVDVIVSVGDVIHDARDDALATGREFFERLAEFDKPVVAIPGNHDPLQYYPDLVGEIPNVVNAHNRVVTASDFDNSHGQLMDNIQFVGWGCEQFDQQPELRASEFPALLPADQSMDRRYVADQLADRIESALYEYVSDEDGEDELIRSLGIAEDNRSDFINQLEETMRSYERLSSLLDNPSVPTVVLSHVPPYNLEADRHHSIGQREADLENSHVGSLSLKLALRDATPIASLHGHSHNPEYELIGEGPVVHSLNLGLQGIASITINPESSGFSYERLAVSE